MKFKTMKSFLRSLLPLFFTAIAFGQASSPQFNSVVFVQDSGNAAFAGLAAKPDFQAVVTAYVRPVDGTKAYVFYFDIFTNAGIVSSAVEWAANADPAALWIPMSIALPKGTTYSGMKVRMQAVIDERAPLATVAD